MEREKRAQDKYKQVFPCIQNSRQQKRSAFGARDSEHCLKVIRGALKIRRTEEHPRKEDKHKGNPPAHGERQPVIEAFFAQPPFEGKQRSVVSAPDYEGPICAVPQSAEEHNQREVQIGPSRSFAVTAQGNVEIVSEESR